MTYYEILEIREGASQAEIKSAFRRLAMVYHPDRNPDLEAVAHFTKIVEAYEILSHPGKRRIYDQINLYGHSEAQANYRMERWQTRAAESGSYYSHQPFQEVEDQFFKKAGKAINHGFAVYGLLSFGGLFLAILYFLITKMFKMLTGAEDWSYGILGLLGGAIVFGILSYLMVNMVREGE